MSLKPCFECNKDISTKAVACPQCGAPQTKGPFCKQVLYSIALMYSVLFWYLFHPYWTGGWVGITRGTWITTSNFICGVIYAGGFYLWGKFLYRNWDN